MLLKDKTTVVTGASRGLGRAIALRFAAEGAKVVATSRTEDELNSLVSEVIAHEGSAIAVPADITDRRQVADLFKQVDTAFGPVELLVNNAGVGIFGDFDCVTAEDLDKMLAVNVKGTFYCAQEAFLRMKQAGRGHIVNVLSTAAKTGKPRESGYVASKWAAAGMTESLRAEAKRFGIRVTSYCPGGINTPFWDSPNGRTHQPKADKFMSPDTVASILLSLVSLPDNVVVNDIVIKRP